MGSCQVGDMLPAVILAAAADDGGGRGAGGLRGRVLDLCAGEGRAALHCADLLAAGGGDGAVLANVLG